MGPININKPKAYVVEQKLKMLTELKLGYKSLGSVSFDNLKNYRCICHVGNCSVINSNLKIKVIGNKDVNIGSDVYINPNVTIESGCKIGDGVIVGPNCYIGFDIPDYAIVKIINNKTKIVSYRYNLEIIELLKQIKWWNWSAIEIENNKWFFELPLHQHGTNQEFLRSPRFINYESEDYEPTLDKIKAKIFKHANVSNNISIF